MKTGIAALALVAVLSLGACAKQGDSGNASATDVTANTTLGDTNIAADNGVDLGGNALDAGGNALDATGGNASNSL